MKESEDNMRQAIKRWIEWENLSEYLNLQENMKRIAADNARSQRIS